MRIKPVCRKCGNAHWAFVACGDPEVLADAEQAARQAAGPVVVRKPDPAEWRSVKLRYYNQIAPGVFVLNERGRKRAR